MTRHDEGRTVRVAGNAEGLVSLASILLGLARDQSKGQHFHFDHDGIFDHCDGELVVAFQPAEWNGDSE